MRESRPSALAPRVRRSSLWRARVAIPSITLTYRRVSMSRVKLWHLPISHFNEKARWALAYKSLDHELVAPLSGPHMAVALWLTKGRHATLPVVELDGRRIGDSTAIIEALEERVPD